MNLSYLSVCSGIEAATGAWHQLGWRPWAFSQFDPEHKGKGSDFASAVLKFHYPDVPNLGDMTKFQEWPDAVFNVLVGGTPCQSYSVAGLRKGLDDPRGDLMLTYVAIARRYRPRWVVWENVPGVLSDDEGRSFGTLLGLLTGRRVEVPSGGWETAGFVAGHKSAYGIAWRVLDSQFVRVDGFGRAVPQRRRRVFVVGYLGDWRRACAVLFERESLSGNPAPRRSSRQDVAGTIGASLARCSADEGERGNLIPETAPTLAESAGYARPGDNIQSVGYLIPEVANPLRARMHKGVNTTMDEGRTMIGEPINFQTRGSNIDLEQGVSGTIGSNADRASGSAPMVAFVQEVADPLVSGEQRTYTHEGSNNFRTRNVVAFSCKDHGADAGEVAPTLRSMGHDGSHANGGGQVAVAFQPRFARNGRGAPDEIASALTGEAGRTGKGDSAQCVAYGIRSDASRSGQAVTPSADAEGRVRLRNPGLGVYEELAPTVDAGQPHSVVQAWAVRRLTPIECERLQGFPDGFTNIPWRGKNGAPDGPRYKVLGNSMSQNAMRWIGTRIEMVEKIIEDAANKN